MSEIINLRRRRKAKARAESDKRAEQNRVAFGLTKAERFKQQKEKAAAIRFVEGHKRETPQHCPDGPARDTDSTT